MFIFPRVGLGVVASRAQQVADEMFVAAARTLTEFSPALADETASLFPMLEDVRKVSREFALAVGSEAQRLGLAEATSGDELARSLEAKMWKPEYSRYRRSW